MDEIRKIGMRAAIDYLAKKRVRRENKNNLIAGLLFLAALVLLVIFYPR